MFFVSLLLLLGIWTGFDLGKFFHLTFQHTAYYCQAFIRSFSIRIPHQWGFLLLILFSLMFILVSVKLFLLYRRILELRKLLNTTVKKQEKFKKVVDTMGLSRKVFLVKSAKSFAFCFGIRNPKIYISTSTSSLMSDDELRAILFHERYHLFKRDTLTLLMAEISQFIFPFFPILSDFIKSYRIDREMKADEEAVNHIGTPAPLLSALTKLLTTPAPATSMVSAIGDYDTLEIRIKSLTGRNVVAGRFSLVHIFISIVSFLVLGAIALSPVYAISNQNSKQETVMICAVGANCASWCTKHQTVHPQSYSPTVSYPFTPVPHAM